MHARLTARVAGLIALTTICAALSYSTRAQTPIVLSIVGTNDLHGAVADIDGTGGLPLLGGFIRNLRAARAADGGVLLVDAGDLFQGTLESNLNEGAVVVSAYNALGYAAATIGNHEFDFGPAGPAATPQSTQDDPRGALKTRVSEARFPFLTANIIDSTTKQVVAWNNVEPSTILNVSGVHIGIIGVTTEGTLRTTMALNTRGLEIAPLATAIRAEAGQLRSKGATVVVVVAHAGGRCQQFDDPFELSSCNPNEEIFALARELPPGSVDVIVAGHRHEGIAHRVAGIAIMSSYWRGRAFGRVDLMIDRSSGRILGQRQFPPREVCSAMRASGGCAVPGENGATPVVYEGLPVVPDEAVATILAPAIAAANARRNEPLGATITETLSRTTDAESPLGNLVADWMRAAADRADLAIVNGGALRMALPAGQVTYGRLFEVFPFDSRQATVLISGAELRTLISENLQRRGSFMLVSGVRATARCDNGKLGVVVRRDDGRPIRDSDRLRAATVDFLATGGDDIFAPIAKLHIDGDYTSTPIVREEIADWLKRNPGTWRPETLLSEGSRRIVYSGERPVTCSER